MPVQSTIPSLKVTRPEVYFGELTNTDVYVKTRQKEFNYPQGETNSLTSYEGNGGILLGGFFRRLIIALDRGDLAKLPFSDDITPESRLLMRRNIRDRVAGARALSHLRRGSVRHRHRRRAAGVDDGRLHHIGVVSLRAALPDGTRSRELPAQQRQGGRRRLRRHHHVLRVRRRGSDRRGVSRGLPEPLQGRIGDAAGHAQARALSRAVPAAAGVGLRAVPHDRSGSVLQPRGSRGASPPRAARRRSADRRRRRWSRISS